ncbi:hypothetical protein TNCV_5049621 [Trichonephila clavipes]|nr:hypothetical protein TNCV_5049621 [Trichonephila clavipes]
MDVVLQEELIGNSTNEELKAYKPPPLSDRYGSCSVLTAIDHRRDSLPSWTVSAFGEHKWMRIPCNHKSNHVLTSNLTRIGLTLFTNLQTSGGINGNRSKTTGRLSSNADAQRIYVWRRPGYWSYPAFVVGRDMVIAQSLKMWRIICWDTRDHL